MWVCRGAGLQALAALCVLAACDTGSGAADAVADVGDPGGTPDPGIAVDAEAGVDAAVEAAEAVDEPDAGPPVCSVRAHGAIGDGVTLDTVAVQAAIDQCAGTGGTTVVEAGTYYIGTIALKGGMTFRLEEGARLLGSTDRVDYIGNVLVKAGDCQGLTLEGPGTIDGNGQYWWAAYLLSEDHWRPNHMVELVDCQDLTVRNLLLTMSGGWHLHLLACDRVLVEHVKIRAPVGDTLVSPNTDGIDIDACQHVEVRDCDVETGDDAICVKNDHAVWSRDSFDINVHDCTVSGWANGLKIGTRPRKPIHGVTFRDCEVHASVDSNPGTRNMGGITMVSDNGADVYDILVERIHMKQVQAPFFLRVQERDLSEEGLGTTQAGRLYGVTLRDLTVDDATMPGLILGIPGHPVEGVALERVKIHSTKAGTAADRDVEPGERNLDYPDAPYFGTMPAFGLFARHVTGPLGFQAPIDLSSTADEQRAAVVLEDVGQVDLGGLPAGTEVVRRP